MLPSPRSLPILCCLALAIHALPAAAPAGEIVRLPLTLSADLVYLSDMEIEVLSFDTAQPWTEILDVRLHLTGTYCCHLIVGSYALGPPSSADCAEPGLVCGFLVGDDEIYPTVRMFTGTWEDQTYDACETQDFEVEIVFEVPADTADWSFLAEGAGTVFLRGLECPCVSVYPNMCFCDPSAVAISAELVVELETGVPVESSSWGAIKAIFR